MKLYSDEICSNTHESGELGVDHCLAVLGLECEQFFHLEWREAKRVTRLGKPPLGGECCSSERGIGGSA
ncbi:hypothetical protein PF007_g16685 [Phytophthora fragariae]|uniref:Uncharacterized protein n=2 Tax=Phytophthora TaxID=4783 RepID=A0A6A3JPU6_9STRA|nr:hypothetical protein PF009_g17825 [Phytophthora fragariae]KAE8971624.1 hypothetical protein PR002_g26767 [Phytophthora rubi]KAE8996801.1 hypothetical protein PF011_g15753 [Phytophthora fragariae]KAE9097273.1 hypothetical protein PF007_g16685 [Phytophthora fragariae]KAE9131564.1 hypothetical protein PF006_g15483 [Phytophthora fragariae]